MPSTRFLERIPYAPDCVMDVVTDVETYPSFVPAMTALRKTRTLPDGFEAEAMINYKGIAETFLSRVIVDKAARHVSVQKAQRGGPVKALTNRWVFHTLSDGSTLVDFYVEVRLVFPLETLLRQKFDDAKHKIRDVFVEQASARCETVGEEIFPELAEEVRRLGLKPEDLYRPPFA